MSDATPNIRFKGCTGDWEQRKLGDMVSFSKGSGYSKGDLKEDGTPIILYGRLYTKYETIISEVDTFVDEKKGSVYSKGGEVIVPASGETAEDISIASVVEKSGVLLGGDLNIITPPTDMDSAFLAISISNGKPHNDMAKMAQGKSVVHLHNSDLEKIDLPYPSYDEQRRISGFFSDLDNLITLHQRKCDETKQLKRYMLQKMFPRNGATRPEIRFSGFTDDWEQRKLGAVFEEYSEKKHEELPPLTIIQGNGTILREESDRALQYDKNSLSGYKMVKKDDFIVHLRSFEGGLEKANQDGIISPAYHTFHGDNTDSRFYYPFFRSKRFIDALLKPHVYGIRDGKSIDIEGMKTILIPVPSYDEQKKIGEFIESIDNLITLHQRKCDSFKQLKAYMLQNMFV